MTISSLARQRWLLAVVFLLTASAQAGPAIAPALKAPLQQVIRHLDQGQPESAIQSLLHLQDRNNLDPYERATLKRFLGHAYLQGDQQALAIQAFEQALAAQALTTTEQHEIRYQLGQLYLREEQPRRAMEQLRGLDPADYPQAAFYLTRAQSQAGAYAEAIETAERRLKDAVRPARHDINHLLVLYRQADRPESAAALARQALGWYPAERLYWRELARLQLQLGEQRAAAATLQAMERQGLLEQPQERDRLIELYRHLDAPLKAAELLEQALTDGRLERNDANRKRLATAWLQARAWDKAEAELTALVVEHAKPVPDWLADLAYCHYKQGHWTRAIDTYRRALATRQLTNAGEAWLLLGIAAVKAKALDTAQAALQEAEAYPRQHRQASQWLEWLDHRANADFEQAS
ncbi:tetratricopeptide repeat protein [Rhabdochromatium marinum]|uniref:tetratricopeptide repeat protein n=1 Tax=Rhabdochromatium marinum TaxID=48729 RepID=UPI001906F9A5|nr:tetratricopeptide repeat protein [Rhabdochromatium marinum]MBK1648967.1 hypothetical protein [Rhabdochromatium marinum]